MISIMATTMSSAASADGILNFCNQNIGFNAINAKNTASKNGTSKTLAACMPNTMTMTAAKLTSALLLLLLDSVN